MRPFLIKRATIARSAAKQRHSLRSVALYLVLGGTALSHAGFAAAQTPPASPEVLIIKAAQYEHGEGVSKNPDLALNLYCAAARLGSAEAAYRMGWMYSNGRGIDRNDDYARALFQHAAERNHEYAQRMLRLVHANDARLPPCIAGESAAIAAAREARPQPTGKSFAHESGRLVLNTRARNTHGKPSTSASNEHAEILATLARWADAWSRKAVGEYLALYAADFALSVNRTPQQWEAERRSRIVEKSWIKVGVVSPKINVEGNVAHVDFRQVYRSDSYNESSAKALTLEKFGDRWLISEERSGR